MPPDPPPRRASWTHLAAPAPPSEAERLRAVSYTDVAVLPEWASDQQKKYVKLAREALAPYASISYISRTHEILRCEVGHQGVYKHDFIPRSDSLAAHAILSSELMVILDTSKVGGQFPNLHPCS